MTTIQATARHKITFRSLHSLLLVFFIIILPCTLAYGAATTSDEIMKEREVTYKKLELFANILSILQENYVEEIDTDQVIEGAINGMLQSLDPHSSYLTPENFQELQDETLGSFTGIGIEVTIKDGQLTVVSPIEDTPAYKAGLLVNDVIVKINGLWTKDMNPMEAIKKLRGPKGSTVTLSIQRKGVEEITDYNLTRDIIPINSVRASMLDQNIAYSRITNFQSNTTEDFMEAIDTLNRKHPLRAIVLDLRNNPGGLLDQAVSLSDLFIDDGIIVYTKGRTKDQNMLFKAKKANTKYTIPLIVLVNEGTASASEIVAGAIQDLGRGLIVGTKTFGKGSVQTIVPLPNGAGLRMTTARYFTPSGRSIQARGITPDVDIPQIDTVAAAEKRDMEMPREKDLQNHIENGTTVAAPATPEDAALAKRLDKDYQLQMALNILKGSSILSKKPIKQQ